MFYRFRNMPLDVRSQRRCFYRTSDDENVVKLKPRVCFMRLSVTGGLGRMKFWRLPDGYLNLSEMCNCYLLVYPCSDATRDPTPCCHRQEIRLLHNLTYLHFPHPSQIGGGSKDFIIPSISSLHSIIVCCALF